MATQLALTDQQLTTYNYIMNVLRARCPNVDLSPGSPTMTNLVIPLLQVLSPIINKQMRFDLMQDPAMREYLTEEEADLFVGRYGFYRNPGSPAVGAVYFQMELPTSDTFTIMDGTTVTTVDSAGNTLDYTVLEDTTYTADTYHAYIGESKAFYEFPARVISSRYGSAYNLDGSAALALVTPIAGCVGVRLATPLQGGADAETNDELFVRFDKSFLGHELGNAPGYTRKLFDTFSDVKDVYVAGYLDSLMLRDVIGTRHIGGKVDLWVKGSILDQRRTDTVKQQNLSFDLHPSWAGTKSGIVTINGGLDGITLGKARFSADSMTRCLFNFDENQGNITADSTGSLVGLFRGNVTWTDGYVGSAIHCPGDGSGVQVPYAGALDLPAEYLVSATVRLEADPGTADGYVATTQSILHKARSVHPSNPTHSSGLCWQLALVDGYPAWFVSNGEETRCYKTDERRVKQGTYQTLTVRRYKDTDHYKLDIMLDDATLISCVDDMTVQETPQSTSVIPGPLEIGYSSERGEAFRGAIDEVYVSNRPEFSAVAFSVGGLHTGTYVSTPREIRTNMLQWDAIDLDIRHPLNTSTDAASLKNGGMAWTASGVAMPDILQVGKTGVLFDESNAATASQIIIDLGRPLPVASLEITNADDTYGTRELQIEYANADQGSYAQLTPDDAANLPWAPYLKDADGALRSFLLAKRSVGLTFTDTITSDNNPTARYLRLTLKTGWGGGKKGLQRVQVHPYALTEVLVHVRTAHAETDFDLPDTHADAPVWRNPFAPFPHGDLTVPATASAPLSHLGGRFIQVRVTLKSAHPFVKPVLKTAKLHYSMRDCVVLPDGPVHRVVSVTNTGTDTVAKSTELPYKVLYVDTDPEFLTDTARSSKETAFVAIQDYGANYAVGDRIEVVYEVNQLIAYIQDYLDDRGRNIVTTDALVKAAYPLYIYFDLRVHLKKDSTGTLAVEAAMRSVLEQYLAMQMLGDQVDQSDIVSVLHANIFDIEYVHLPFSVFYADGTKKTNWLDTHVSAQTLTAPKNAYFAFGGLRVTFA